MNYPSWICHECGMKHGNGKRSPVSCWHEGECDICKRETAVTEPRDYGHLSDSSIKLLSMKHKLISMRNRSNQ